MDTTFKDRENVFRITTTHLDSDELMGIMTVERQLHGVNAIFLDYIGLVSPPKTERGESWASTANLAKNLHRFSVKNEVVIVTAAQVSETKKSKDGLSIEVTSRGSAEIKFSSSQFLYIEIDNGSAILYMVKNRLNALKHVMAEPNFATMKFTDQDIILN
jgi:hypothetical protein